MLINISLYSEKNLNYATLGVRCINHCESNLIKTYKFALFYFVFCFIKLIIKIVFKNRAFNVVAMLGEETEHLCVFYNYFDTDEYDENQKYASISEIN